MSVLRTPDSCFHDLPDYDFAPRYTQVKSPHNGPLRLHYLDEGPRDAPETVLMLHGEPTWSYLYRKMIPIVAAAGHRVIAPDLIGFGKSDKLRERKSYSYAQHVAWLTEFITNLNLQRITLVCQDWGGLLGLRLAAENEERFVRISAANTFLPTGDRSLGRTFKIWRAFSQYMPWLPVGRIVSGGAAAHPLPPEVVAAYNAPFPSERYKAAARHFPVLVPATPDDPAVPANRAAWKVLQAWHKPFLTAFSDGDPITAGLDKVLQEAIPGAKGQPHVTLPGGHFLQEDAGPEWARIVVEFMRANPL
ncbi:haloalkane dehalogenase [Hymenobacter terrenus]|uniref:haloalkane dehalogenase n=1 Tax=Hymenobacter terrenus TaxID=1629124 RepID=UPI00061986DE|nr:haloalkane dehalogenase [Hymenobacter terrenus]